jgi:hypothetical protein
MVTAGALRLFVNRGSFVIPVPNAAFGPLNGPILGDAKERVRTTCGERVNVVLRDEGCQSRLPLWTRQAVF